MTDSSSIRVQIFGSEYPLSTEENAEHTRKVAQYVDRKMREIAHQMSLRSVAQIAVLTAVNLADELFKEMEEGQKMHQIAVEKADLLGNSLNRIAVE